MRAVENHRVGAEFGGEFIVNVSHGEFAAGRRRVVQNRLKEEPQFGFCFVFFATAQTPYGGGCYGSQCRKLLAGSGG